MSVMSKLDLAHVNLGIAQIPSRKFPIPVPAPFPLYLHSWKLALAIYV